MLPYYFNSENKFPLYTGNSFNYIILIKFSITIYIIGLSVWNIQSLNINKTLIKSSETKHGLSEQWLNWLTGLIKDAFLIDWLI